MSDIRVCKKCQQEKPIGQFHKKIGHVKHECRECVNSRRRRAWKERYSNDEDFRKKWIRRSTESQRRNIEKAKLRRNECIRIEQEKKLRAGGNETRICSRCSREKPTERFKFTVNGHRGGVCKDCTNTRQNELRNSRYLNDANYRNNTILRIRTWMSDAKVMTRINLNRSVRYQVRMRTEPGYREKRKELSLERTEKLKKSYVNQLLSRGSKRRYCTKILEAKRLQLMIYRFLSKRPHEKYN